MAKIGSLNVSAQGFGAMGLSSVYGQADDAESIRTIHRAIELGVTFFDTATAYGSGHNEELLGKAIAGRRNGLVIASKFTHARQDGTRTSPRAAVEASLRRLNVDHIDLYYLHRVDTLVPIEESVGLLGQLKDEGKIGGVGISEASAAQIRRAHAESPLTALQSEYSLWTRDVEVEILAATRELGIGFVAYSPLGRGFLAGAESSGATDRRAIHPRFRPDAIAANSVRRRTIEDVAERLRVTPAQVSLAWVLAKGVVPIPGTRHIRHLEDNWAAGDIHLDEGTIEELEAAFPRGATFGDRYPPEQLRQVPAEPALA
ncbi:aldo/keto reductase [Sphingomonas sp.]|uniref:aldo/keto reductase n=1 Tax=Sphingomonas sp. TaxID=28214 RepID=UPI000DB3C839|nr:aldo/keto reductase [Sphingomonas sp.]PZU09801.1 MAG: aldo/keto reductase [Sphingomonas sp.]